MSSGLVAILVVVALVIILVIMVISIYNTLVTLKGRFENAFAQIAVQLKRRHDLIPNIVESSKAYMKHESETLRKVIEARNTAAASLQGASANPGDASCINSLNLAEKNLGAAFQGLRVQLEAYPELKANTMMLQLNEELVSTENRVSFARQAFNDAVTAYNIQRKVFPTSLLAATFGHPTDAVLLAFDDAQAIQNAPQISF